MLPVRRHAWGVWLALGLLVLVGGWARIAGQERSSLWFDEVITLEEASRPTLEETIRAKVVHPPLMRVAARLSLFVLGDPGRDPGSMDLALRMPSVLMGTAAIVALFFFARTYSDDDDLVGLTAAAAWALLPYGIWLSREARFYAALVLFVAWTLFALARFHRRGRARDYVHLALPLVLGCYTHYVFCFVFILTALTVVPTMLAAPRRRWALSLPWLMAGAAFLPWLGLAVTELEPQDRQWVGPLARHFRDVPVAFFTGRFGYYHLRSRDAVFGGAVVLLALGLVIHFVRRRAGFARISAALVIPSLAITATLHHGVVETPLFHPKYLAFLYPFACLALGELVAFSVGWSRASHIGGTGGAARRDACAPLVLAVALGASVPVGRALTDVYGRMAHGQRQPYQQAARWIAQRRGEAELVVVLECSRNYNELALRHYGLRPPLASLRCRDAGAHLPASSSGRPFGRTFAVLTHWGDERVRDAAVETLRVRYGEVMERSVLRGVDGDVMILALSRRGAFDHRGGCVSSGRRERCCSSAHATSAPRPSRSNSSRTSPSRAAASSSAPSHITYPRSRIQSSMSSPPSRGVDCSPRTNPSSRRTGGLRPHACATPGRRSPLPRGSVCGPGARAYGSHRRLG